MTRMFCAGRRRRRDGTLGIFCVHFLIQIIHMNGKFRCLFNVSMLSLKYILSWFAHNFPLSHPYRARAPNHTYLNIISPHFNLSSYPSISFNVAVLYAVWVWLAIIRTLTDHTSSWLAVTMKTLVDIAVECKESGGPWLLPLNNAIYSWD